MNFGDSELNIDKDKLLEIWVNVRNPFGIILSNSWMRILLSKVSKKDIIGFSKKYNFMPLLNKDCFEKSHKIRMLDSLVWHIGLENLKPNQYDKYCDKLHLLYHINKA